MLTRKIQLFLINGFLGSGKATFLVKLLSLFSSQRYGVLMNEFGEIGIDGLLLPQKDLELIEIDGGSIFYQFSHLDDGQCYYLDSVNSSLSMTQTNTIVSQTEIVVIFKEDIEKERVNKAERLWVSLIA